MTTALFYLARWLAWQLSEVDAPTEERPARITVISGARDG